MSSSPIGSQNQTLPPLQVWDSLLKSDLPPPENKDIEFWWHLTGPQLASMLVAAGYSSAKQNEILLFHYYWIVPRLGPAPNLDGQPAFKSLVVGDGSPLAYSWKWNKSTGEPEIGCVFEAFGTGSRTVADPLNHDPTLQFLAEMDSILPDANSSRYRSFMQELYSQDRAVYAQKLETGEWPATTTLMQAVEFNKNAEFGLKSYFLVPRLTSRPYWSGHLTPRQQWDVATEKLTDEYPGNAQLRYFLKWSQEGRLMRPNIIGMEDAAPDRSRLKMYYSSPSTSFRAVREIMTLDRMRAVPERNLQDLRSLILTVLGLAADYPEEAEMVAGGVAETGDAPGAGYTYSFDINLHAKPGVKFYLPIRQYGADDLTSTRNLIDWLRSRDRAAYADAYLAALAQIACHRGLAHGKGILTHISYQCTADGEADIKCYIGPDVYHKARYPSANDCTRPELKDSTEDISMSA